MFKVNCLLVFLLLFLSSKVGWTQSISIVQAPTMLKIGESGLLQAEVSGVPFPGTHTLLWQIPGY